jgi:hypothetical protein
MIRCWVMTRVMFRSSVMAGASVNSRTRVHFLFRVRVRVWPRLGRTRVNFSVGLRTMLVLGLVLE